MCSIAMLFTGVVISLLSQSAIASPESNWAALQRSATEALDTNKYWLAEPLLKRCVKDGEKFGADSWRYATSLAELGRLYIIRRRFGEAEPLLEKELAVRELAVGKEDGKIIPAMGSLVKFYLFYGTQRKAVPLADDMCNLVTGKMTSTRSKTVSKDSTKLELWAGTADTSLHPMMEWAIACDSVGNAFRVQKKWDMAEKLFKTALEVKTTVVGKQHLSLATTYDNLGMMYFAKEDYAEAANYFREAFESTELVLTPESPEVYARLDKLARCLVKLGKTDQAEGLYRHALAMWKKEPSKAGDEPRALYALGCLYLKRRQYGPAANTLRQALQLAETVNGPYQIALYPYLEQYAYAVYHLGRAGESRRLKARADIISGGLAPYQNPTEDKLPARVESTAKDD